MYYLQLFLLFICLSPFYAFILVLKADENHYDVYLGAAGSELKIGKAIERTDTSASHTTTNLETSIVKTIAAPSTSMESLSEAESLPELINAINAGTIQISEVSGLSKTSGHEHFATSWIFTWKDSNAPERTLRYSMGSSAPLVSGHLPVSLNRFVDSVRESHFTANFILSDRKPIILPADGHELIFPSTEFTSFSPSTFIPYFFSVNSIIPPTDSRIPANLSLSVFRSTMQGYIHGKRVLIDKVSPSDPLISTLEIYHSGAGNDSGKKMGWRVCSSITPTCLMYFKRSHDRKQKARRKSEQARHISHNRQRSTSDPAIYDPPQSTPEQRPPYQRQRSKSLQPPSPVLVPATIYLCTTASTWLTQGKSFYEPLNSLFSEKLCTAMVQSSIYWIDHFFTRQQLDR